MLHLDVVSAYLHANLTGPARYITLWEDEKGTMRQLFKAVNGIGNAAQLWKKHLAGITAYTVTPILVCKALNNHVDNVLAAADAKKKTELDKFVI